MEELKSANHQPHYRELVNAKERAETALREQSRFFSVMSHEIRTPMNAIVGFCNLLLENQHENQEEYLRLLKFSADSLLVIINDILHLNKIEEGMVKLEEAEFDLNELLQNICSINKQVAAQKGIGVELYYDSSLPHCFRGDCVRLGQVITNLVSNAMKFTAAGQITISAKLENADRQYIQLYFEVSDTGIGIPEDKQEHIFDLFTQAESDTTRKFGGTGLGLAISRKLVGLMGGDLVVKSKPGEGSTFYFSIPLLKTAPVNTPALTGPPDGYSHLAGLKILLADDNPINVLVMKRYLVKWGIECDDAEDGLEAVQKAKQRDYDLVLMDLHMPVMDGYEATRAIRRISPAKESIPIIAITASVAGDVLPLVRASHMDDCLSKPFKPEDLYRLIERYTQKE